MRSHRGSGFLGLGSLSKYASRSSTWSFCSTFTMPAGMFDTSDLRRSTMSFFGIVTASPEEAGAAPRRARPRARSGPRRPTRRRSR